MLEKVNYSPLPVSAGKGLQYMDGAYGSISSWCCQGLSGRERKEIRVAGS